MRLLTLLSRNTGITADGAKFNQTGIKLSQAELQQKIQQCILCTGNYWRKKTQADLILV